MVAAWCLLGVAAEPDTSVGLHWCSTMCMCPAKTQDQLRCFERAKMFEFLGYADKMARRLLRSGWKMEEKVYWCSDLCLCHTDNDNQFQCVLEDNVNQFINDNFGYRYFYDWRVEVEERAVEDDKEQQAKEAEKNKNKKKKNKPKKNVKAREESVTPREEKVQVITPAQPQVESLPTTERVMVMWPTTTTTLTPTTTTIPTTTTTTKEEVMEEEAELLPKQEAVAASPAVTAMQPPTRRQPFPPTAPAPHASTREVHTLPPKTSAVLEVPVERKTVASEVSQDLDELGTTVHQIKDDVVLNQRILLVTVAIAGIAMLGVVILAVTDCHRRRQLAPDTKKREASATEDNHATKVNLEQAW